MYLVVLHIAFPFVRRHCRVLTTLHSRPSVDLGTDFFYYYKVARSEGRLRPNARASRGPGQLSTILILYKVIETRSTLYVSMSLNALPCIARPTRSTITPLRASTSANRHCHAFHTSPQPRHRFATHPEQPRTSTVNDAEIAHFSRLSALWWDERGEFALLHKMNAHRMRFIREKVLEARREEEDHGAPAVATRVLDGLDVLDVGCGGGILSEARISP